MNNCLEVLKHFNDYSNIDYRNMPYIGAMIKENYINGYEDSTIRAKGYITRAELTSILDNMVGDIFSSGKYSDRIIKGNLVINGEGISLQNVKVEGNIFIMDGTRDNKPLLNNVETSKGIISKVGNIEINDPNESKTLSNISPIGDKTPPVFAKITYTTTCWTNDDITATIRFDNSKTKVVNNSGRKSYIFEDNGEFVFNCEDEEGNNFDFKAKVDNIDKTKPKITIQTESILGGKKISVLIEDDEESPFDGVYYLKGNFSSSYTALRGEYAPNNTFE
jgi:hypothetical protein